jgi:hypothetical protein
VYHFMSLIWSAHMALNVIVYLNMAEVLQLGCLDPGPHAMRKAHDVPVLRVSPKILSIFPFLHALRRHRRVLLNPDRNFHCKFKTIPSEFRRGT